MFQEGDGVGLAGARTGEVCAFEAAKVAILALVGDIPKEESS